METKKPLYNPLKDDFSYQIRDDTNTLITLFMPSKEITFFVPHEYEYMKKHLLDELYHLQGDVKKDRDMELKRLEQLVLVEL